MTAAELVLVSLGSNIDPARNLRRAVALIAAEMDLVGVSRAWESPPVGCSESPLFLNAAVEIACRIPPRELKFDLLRPMERRLGRSRGSDRNAPRTIDLDIALFGDRIFVDRQAGLEIPDPGILAHAHVALPLGEVAPGRRHPTDGRTLREIADVFRENRDIRPLRGRLLSVEQPTRENHES